MKILTIDQDIKVRVILNGIKSNVEGFTTMDMATATVMAMAMDMAMVMDTEIMKIKIYHI